MIGKILGPLKPVCFTKMLHFWKNKIQVVIFQETSNILQLEPEKEPEKFFRPLENNLHISSRETSHRHQDPQSNLNGP